jgi:hypothetical protein
MLDTIIHHHRPFPFFHCTDTFSNEVCEHLRTLFGSEEQWQDRNEGFYQCFLRDVSNEIPHSLKSSLVRKMSVATGLPLTDQVHITAQRMECGQSVGIHSDQPLLGYEIARLVVQLNKDWTSSKGGNLELLEAREGSAIQIIEPHHNHSFGFVLHPTSYHRVSKVYESRWSVVFNFWHPANTPDFASVVDQWTLSFNSSLLPKDLDEQIIQAEGYLSEEVTFTALLVAWLLQVWEYKDRTIINGYAVFVGTKDISSLSLEDTAAIRLSIWVASVHQEHFSIEKWKALQELMVEVPIFPRLREVMHHCCPNVI